VGAEDRIRVAEGIEVSRLGLGGLHLSGPGFWGPPTDPGAARRLLHRALELGVEFIDTADTYGGSEQMLADALHPYPPELIIATKGGLERDGPEIGEFTPWPRNGDPKHLKRACEASLKRLRQDCFPLYQLHSPDPEVPLLESVGALKELQEERKIWHVGVPNVTSEELAVARSVVDVVSVQNNCSGVTASTRRCWPSASAMGSRSSPGTPWPTASCRKRIRRCLGSPPNAASRPARWPLPGCSSARRGCCRSPGDVGGPSRGERGGGIAGAR
jgi:aryl-alcohol dehydrogenase-like predicted oxidoreductase